MIVLDTSAVSTIMHRVPASLEKLQHNKPADIILVAPVAAEISFGLHRLTPRSRRRRILEEQYRHLREVVRWVDWGESAALEFGRQKARLLSRGETIDDMDIVIGSIAIQLDARLATHNAKHFRRLQGLSVEDWGPPLP
jgi:predicted nucleic acid-binding protein